MNPLDTVMWIANFVASHAYAVVFIAAFSLFGLLALSSKAAVPGGALRRVREREGLLPDGDRARGAVLGGIRVVVARVAAVVMLASLIVGILSLTGVPVTRAYIHDNGRPTTGTVDGDWVTFSLADGTEYTLPNNFFSPAVYPDRDAYLLTGQPVVVRYLPGHPQAFVIDSSQLPE